MNPTQIVEAVLFASEAPLKAEEIARADDALNEDLVEEAIQELNVVYSESERAFEIRELGEGYQLLTRADFAPYLERFDTIPRPSRLSGPALETLARRFLASNGPQAKKSARSPPTSPATQS